MPIPAFRADGWLPVGHHPATWEEVTIVFGGPESTRRARLTAQLLALRDALRAHRVVGSLLLDGSYISMKLEPGDFDVLLIAPADIQNRKDIEPPLADLLDTERAEKQRGYSIFYIPSDSPVVEQLRSLWDYAKDGTPKGVVEVSL